MKANKKALPATGKRRIPDEVNAPRKGYPPSMVKGVGDFSPEYLMDQADMGVCFDLVRIASQVLHRSLFMRMGTEDDGTYQAYTDGRNIYVPRQHPQRRIVTKHEISHIYFKSNIPLRLLFVQDMISKVEQEANKPFHPGVKAQLVNDLCFLINIFDDLRVNSLWGLLYPGDGQEMEEWYQGDVGPRMLEKANKDYENGDIQHLFTYMILVCLGQHPKSTKWGEFEGDIRWTADQVYFKTFSACLLLVRDLVLKITRRVCDREKEERKKNAAGAGNGGVPNPTDRPDDDEELQKAQKATGGGENVPEEDLDEIVSQRIQKAQPPEPDAVEALTTIESHQRPNEKQFIDHNAGFDFLFEPQQLSPSALKSLNLDLQDVLELQDKDLEEVLQDLEANAVDEVVELQAAIATKQTGPSNFFRSEEEFLKHDVKSQVRIVKVPAEGAARVMDVKDYVEAERWKRFFQRVMGSVAHQTEEMGFELLTDLYVQQKVGQEPLTCYKTDTAGRGFRVNLCIDLSGSMVPVMYQVERLACVLGRALSFPLVKRGIWGFNSKQAGVVDLYKIPESNGLGSGLTVADGWTPLSQAIQVIGRDLLTSQDEKHLIVITDGFPVYFLSDRKRSVSTSVLLNWTADAVRVLRAQGVNIYCFMIGGHGAQDAEMDKMFGAGFWKYVGTDDMYDKAFELLREKFVQFLRRR